MQVSTYSHTSHLGSADCQYCIMSLTGGSQDLLENVWIRQRMYYCNMKSFSKIILKFNKIFFGTSTKYFRNSIKYFFNFLEHILERVTCQVWKATATPSWSPRTKITRLNTPAPRQRQGDPVLVSPHCSYHHCCVKTVSVSFFLNNFVSWPFKVIIVISFIHLFIGWH